MAAGRPAKYSILVLQANNINVADIQEVRRTQIRRQILLFYLETNDVGVCIRLSEVIDSNRETLAHRVFGGHCLEQVRRKCRDAALTGQMSAQKRDLSDLGALNHRAGRR